MSNWIQAAAGSVFLLLAVLVIALSGALAEETALLSCKTSAMKRST